MKSLTNPLKIKSFLSINFEITNFFAIHLPQNGTRMGDI